MKFLKWVLGILLLLVVLYLLVAAFVAPKNLKIEQSATMKAPANMVYNMVNDLKAWDEWSPWNKMDTAMVNTYSDMHVGKGAKVSWDGPKAGKGTQEIVETVKGESVRTEMFFDGFDEASYSNWKFEEGEDGTKVSWDFDGGKTPFIMRPMNLMMKGAIKQSYTDGLAAIKEIAEKKASERMYDGYKVNNIDLGDRHFVMNRSEVGLDNISQFYQQNLGALFGKVQQAGAEMSGMPCGIFFKYDEQAGIADMAAAIPVKEATEVSGATSYTVPAGKALQIDYYGDYSGTASAHMAMEKCLNDFGLTNKDIVIEEYVTDPSQEKDPAKWLTKITYMLAN